MSDNKTTKQQPSVQMGPGRPGGPGGPGGRNAGMFAEKVRAKNAKGTLKRLLKYLGKSKFLLLFMLLMVLCSAGAALLSPVLQKTAIDALTITDKQLHVNWDALFQTMILMGCVYLASILFTFLQGWLGATLAQRTVRIMRDDLFIKLSKLPIRYFDQHTHGELMSRLTNDIDNVSNTLSSSVTTIISSIITVTGALFMMIYYNWLMTILTVLCMPVGVVLTRLIAKKTRRFFKEQQSSLGELNGHIEEMVTGQKTVQAFNREDESIETFCEINERLRKASIRAQIYSGLVGPLMNVSGNLSFSLVAISGGWMAINGHISVGVIQAFVQLSKQFTRPINEIANQYNTIQSALAGAERVFEVMDQENESDQGTDPITVDEICGNVRFDHVFFSYKQGEPVLRDFTLDVKQGQKIALVGPTGAGKTTVVNLLTRFYDVDSGSIYLDEKELRELPKKTLRGSIGIVLQDTVLFTGTVADNIRFGKPEATDEEVIRAATMANADVFIRRLPDGYNTQLSESGSNLSQGQRQLLSIARAILADPKILILDEATSSVDTRTEMNIQKAMIALMKGRTSFIIAHRLSTIRDADRIVVMKAGQIVEQGNHRELLDAKGHYYELHRAQFTREEV